MDKFKKDIIIVGISLFLLLIFALYFKFNFLENNQISEKSNQAKNREIEKEITKGQVIKNNVAESLRKENNEEKILMEVKIPKLVFNDELDKFVIEYSQEEVLQSRSVLGETYKKYFEIGGATNSRNGLKFKSAALNDGVVRLDLSGKWMPSGDMSGMYFRREIEDIAFQFESVKELDVYLNGEIFNWCIDDLSDGEGGCPSDKFDWKVKKKILN